MKKFGLIGYPLSHSFSKGYFTEKFEKEGLDDYSYELFPLKDISDLPELLKKEHHLCGLNVTIPHKIGVMFYLNKIDEAARDIDAVNCIKIVNSRPVDDFFSGEISSMDVRLEGYNTDAYGFEESLKPLLNNNHKQALVLGNGGAARAVVYVLKKLGISFKVVSRRSTRNQFSYSEIDENVISDYKLIINTTPLGMSPQTGEYPDIPYQYLTDKHLLYDLIYNPEETLFLKKGKERGASVKNGLEMLHLQAEKSWEIWND
ncbi:shikimate dehydrogenase [Pedobacter sp. HMF7647]|uniref:Shikimate dehydrogenase n=1 Tax=Hufsiella arboris TaxID=2695275 RepID=A0A7K1Y558_9SPHI|nr:shikimate dehydrogenase [Hufsiella arboris]MXV49550.1 shikimate dehydrogenase [Hufsiella arboris]